MGNISKIRTPLVASIAVILVVNLATLTAYPPPHCDETYYADTAQTFLTQGRFGTPVHGPIYDLDKNHTIIGRLYTLGLAGIVAALGVSLAASRIYSILGWLAAVAGTYWLGTRLYSRRTALWAALLFGVSFKAFFAAHITRPEIWLTAGIVWVFAALVNQNTASNWSLEPVGKLLAADLQSAASQRRIANPAGANSILQSKGDGFSRRRAFLLGLAAALLADFHFNGVFFLSGLSLVALYQWFVVGRTTHYQLPATSQPLTRRRRFDLILAFFAGTAIGLGLWAALHFLPDPASAWYQWSVGHTRLGMGAGGRNPLTSLLDLGPWILEGWWNGNRGLNAVEGILAAGGIGWALARRSRADTQVLLTLAGSLLTYGVLFAQKSFTYRLLWSPLLWLLAVEAVLAAWDRVVLRFGSIRPVSTLGPALVFVPLMALYFVSAGWVLWQFRDGHYAETTEQLRALIPPGTTVLGDPIWWFGFQGDHRYYGDLYLTYYASAVSSPPGAVPVVQRLTEDQVAEALRTIGAQFVILDARLHCLQDENYQPFYAYRDYVTAHCSKVGEVAGAWYGQSWAVTYPLGEKSEVYRCG